MAEQKTMRGPGGRRNMGPRPKLENPGQIMKRLMGIVLSKYKFHLVIVVIGIIVSSVVQVVSMTFLKTLFDTYIAPLLTQQNPDFMPLAKGLMEISGLFAIALALSGCSTGDKSSGGVSGTFTGTAVGMGGNSNPVTVTLTLTDSVITDVKAEGPGETEGIGSKAIDALPQEMIDSNSVNVDTVSGATITSKAIIEAATAALKEAGLEPSDLQAKETSSTTISPFSTTRAGASFFSTTAGFISITSLNRARPAVPSVNTSANWASFRMGVMKLLSAMFWLLKGATR